MKKPCLMYLCVLLCINGGTATRPEALGRSPDGSEAWGYVEVRPKAHMFWWLYRSPYRVEDPSKPWPVILWLQGGPGASGVGIGNFQEVGPLDTYLKPRNSTWLKKADLLFVDSPVGAGYSFVEESGLYVRSDGEAADDLTALLKEVMGRDETLRRSPLFIVAESYGGKIAVKLGLSLTHSLNPPILHLGGVVLGDSWISPEDFVLSWGPLLNYVARLDDKDLEESNSLAQKIKKQLEDGLYFEATESWMEIQSMLSSKTNSVVRWGGSSNAVFTVMQGDFMRPRIDEVNELLAKGVNVTIYNGQLDVICSTRGVEAWLHKLKWEGLQEFRRMDREPIFCGDDNKATRGFTKSHKNLSFYWILGAGHFVPVDEPCVALKMVEEITKSPSTIS
ncbi:PREDICTED: serine carboxypeptidase-like 51 [Tarenaya hassleriana]|uniref:serine carboxypeptidase-like 51 n=1 Tax=Tarenaya hassleriana TaxID=28532 RepID=UPI00053C95CD|nr:PREDICTED: serine carboxypeptidase-like 51 [Tarenaya hassleriana]